MGTPVDATAVTSDLDGHEHPLDAYVPDPSSRSPLCGEHQFAEILRGMVADNAPELFAVVQEYGNRVDARIAAWGMAFPDRAEVVALEGGLRLRLRLRHPDEAMGHFHFGTHIHPGSCGSTRQRRLPLTTMPLARST